MQCSGTYSLFFIESPIISYDSYGTDGTSNVKRVLVNCGYLGKSPASSLYVCLNTPAVVFEILFALLEDKILHNVHLTVMR